MREFDKDLIIGYLQQTLDDAEKQRFYDWINESEENKDFYFDLKTLYDASVSSTRKYNIEKSWKKLLWKRRLRHLTEKRFYINVAKYAAVLLLGMLMMQYLAHDKQEPTQILEVKTNPGMTTSFTLPDGTLVFLNSESTLTYPSRFDSDSRNISLQGEAFFKVAKDPEKKFFLSTSHQSQIEVLGTQFNVEAYEKEDKISTTLVEGKIDFIYKYDNVFKKVMMNPGHKLVYNSKEGKAQLYTTSGESETAWKDGKIIFKDTPLEESMRMLEKRFNVEFIITNDRLKEYSFTGTFSKQRLERILQYFQLSSKIQWRYIESPDIEEEKSKIEIY